MVVNNENALKAEDVAKILKIGRNAVYDMAKRGEIGSYKIGRKLRFTYADVQNYIDGSHNGGPSPADTGAFRSISSGVSGSFAVSGHGLVLDVQLDQPDQAEPQTVRLNVSNYNMVIDKEELGAQGSDVILRILNGEELKGTFTLAQEDGTGSRGERTIISR